MMNLGDITQFRIGFLLMIIIVIPFGSVYAQVNAEEETRIPSEHYVRVEADLRTDMNGDGRIEDNDNIPEEDDPGKYIAYNNDYDLDPTNNRADWEWGPEQKVQERFTQEDEFCKIHMNLFPLDQAGNMINIHIKKGILKLEREDPNIRVWWKDTNENQYKQVLDQNRFEYWNLEIDDPELEKKHSRDFYEFIKDKMCVEGIKVGTSILTLSYYKDFNTFNNNGTPEHSDSVKFNIIKTYIEKSDPEFPDSNLRWNDYYPALGDKTIVVKSEPINAVDGMKIRCEVDPDIDCVDIKVGTEVRSETHFNNEGKAEFRLSATGLAPNSPTVSGTDQIRLKFILFSDQNAPVIEIYERWNVKNNYNTQLSEVLNGKAVFVQDLVFVDNHRGRSEPNTPDNDKKIDFIQELLNQVVPRKRGLNEAYSFGPSNDPLIGEDGFFGGYTEKALRIFRSNFGMAGIKTNPNDSNDQYRIGNTRANFTNTDGVINYVDSGEDADDTTDTFRKLMKDYGHREDPNASRVYLHKIIDKETLVGRHNVASDNIINGRTIPGTNQDAQDTGLYELYDNVVKIFIQNLINLAESYSINSDPNNVPRQWTARTGQIIQTTANTTQPVAYSFGGRQTIHEFNTTVSKHRAPSYNDIENNPDYRVYQDYRGNIGDASDNEQNPLWLMHGIVGNGARKWPGLYQDDEWSSWSDAGGIPDHCYNPSLWAGIDCIRFVLQALRYAEDPPAYAQEQYLGGNQDTSIRGINVDEVCVNADCSDTRSIRDDYTMGYTNVRRFFDSRNTDLLHQWPGGQYETIRRIHKGDFASYDDFEHISIIYSERQDHNDYSYYIIHASGRDEIRYGTAGPPLFNRKVVINQITGILIPSTLRNPELFGRLKLWEE